jgi:hypothetical protein
VAPRLLMTTSMKYSTDTVLENGEIVPWLAAKGPLSYTPESPPKSDKIFDYARFMPSIFSEVRRYGNYYPFGATEFPGCPQLLGYFWNLAREKKVKPLYILNGRIWDDGSFRSPIAVYEQRFPVSPNNAFFILIQQGRYQILPIEEQPLLPSGELTLYRGIHKFKEGEDFYLSRSNKDEQQTLSNLAFLQNFVFSDSLRSFKVAHYQGRDFYNEHLIDRSYGDTWEKIAEEAGLTYDKKISNLATNKDRIYSLSKLWASDKMGPNYIKYTTPVNNVVFSSWFTSGACVRILNLDLLLPTEYVGGTTRFTNLGDQWTEEKRNKCSSPVSLV